MKAKQMASQEQEATKSKGHRYERSKDATRGSWPYY